VTKYKLMGSAADLAGLAALASKHFCSTITFVCSAGADTWDVHNSNGRIEGLRVRVARGRYRLERETS